MDEPTVDNVRSLELTQNFDTAYSLEFSQSSIPTITTKALRESLKQH